MNSIHFLLQSNIIHLSVLCIAIVAIVFLFLNTKINNDSRKLHLLYITGILVFIVIELVSYICLNSSEGADIIISYVSFASTLSSLILSVVAIIYTIVTNQKGNDVFIRISDKAEVINKVSSDLCTVVQSLDEKLSKFQKELQDIHKIANETNSIINGFSNASANKELGTDVDADKILSHLIQAGSIFGNAALLACCYSKKEEKSIDLKKIFHSVEEYVYGYLIAVNSLTFISVNIKEEQVVCVDYVHKDLETFLKEFFISQNVEICDLIKEIQKYFGVEDLFWKPENNK